ncbi:MAG: prolyl oligopeptidase family serine peptidase [Candidatus Saliniplasma sp.]
MNIKNLSDYTFLSNPNFSPDEKHICFSHHEMDTHENEYINTLWIMEVESGRSYKLTNSGKDSNYTWMNDEEIIFTSGREMGVKEDNEDEEKKEETKFFKIKISGGEAEHLFTIDKKVMDIKRSKSGLFVRVWEKIEDEGKKSSKKDDEEELEEGKDYHELDEIPFWSNEEGFSNKKRTHLYELDIDKGELELLVGGYKNVTDFDIQGDDICMVINEYVDMYEVEYYLYEMDLKTKEMEQLTDEILEIARVRYLKGDILFEATDMERMGINTNMELYLYSHEKDDHEQLTDMDRSLGNSLLTDVKYGGGEIVRVENGNYYFLVTEDYNVGLYKFTLKDGVEPVIQKEGSIDSFDVHDGKIVYAALRGPRPQELYLFDGEEKRLTDFNRLDLDLSEPEYFEVKSEDRKIDAWIMKPVDYKQGERYPTILEIHGCPKCVYGTVHFNEMQLLANSGYVVVFSNPSGSSGNGDDFADIMGEYGGPDFVDLMNVMDEALKRYDYIDEDRLGVTGGSYGGYMTNWVIGHTDRFSAAVSFRSISNWVSKFGTTDIGYYFVKDQILADPWDDVEQLWDRSPMKYADRVDTPTLFITSRKDYRCWEAEAIQMFTSLKYHGVESKLVLFEDENHNLSREGKPKQRMKRLEEMLDWFDMHLK